MKDFSRIFINKKVLKSIIIYEIICFVLIIATSWFTAIFDPPYTNFHMDFNTVDIYETAFETLLIIIIGTIVITVTYYLLRRIDYLEGFIVMCASCKQARINDEWFPIEKVISDYTDLKISHSICPSCMDKLYGETSAEK